MASAPRATCGPKPPRPRPRRAADTAIARAQVDRFRAALAAIVGAGAVEHDRYLIAVSGGPDSIALLALAAAALPDRIVAATVNHGLRAEAKVEAETVARLSASIDVRHITLIPDRPITGSIQAAARTARYELLARAKEAQGCAWIMTAHHADDQLETFVMRLNRGSGVGGLASIRARNGLILRPLLGWTRAELRAICHDAALPFHDDPSNSDTRFDRTKTRTALAGQQLLDPAAVVRSAAALGDADRALDWAVARVMQAWPPHIDVSDEDLPDELLRRAVVMALRRHAPDFACRGATLDRALALMRAGRQAMIGDWMLVPVTGGWQVRRAPPRKNRP